MALSDNMTGSDNLTGAGLMVAAMAAFTLNDTCVKLLAGALPLSQVIALRGILTCVLIAAAALWLGKLTWRMSRADAAALLIRSLAEMAAAYFFLTALYNMPIATLTAILQALPLAVTLGAALVLGETVGWRRITAILVGFVGVMLIVRPGTEDFTLHAAYGVLTVVCATVRDLATRRLSRAVPSLTATLGTALAVTLLGIGMSATGADWQPMGLRETALIVAAAAMVCTAYLTIIMAMRVGDVGFIAPFRYSGLVVAMVVGLSVFGEWPDRLTLIGSAIVVGSGLYALWRERRQRPVPPRGAAG